MSERTVPINEIFAALQGEGTHTGVPSVFVRVSGCLLACEWCDTKYSWKPKEEEFIPLSELKRRVDEQLEEHPYSQVVFTGGDPLLYASQLDWVGRTLQNGRVTHVQWETSGAAYFQGVFGDFVVSPKLSSSKNKLNPLEGPYLDCLRRWQSDKRPEFKFVIGSEQDKEEAVRLLELLSEGEFRAPRQPGGAEVWHKMKSISSVTFQQEGGGYDKLEDLSKEMGERLAQSSVRIEGDVRFLPQLHKLASWK